MKFLGRFFKPGQVKAKAVPKATYPVDHLYRRFTNWVAEFFHTLVSGFSFPKRNVSTNAATVIRFKLLLFFVILLQLLQLFYRLGHSLDLNFVELKNSYCVESHVSERLKAHEQAESHLSCRDKCMQTAECLYFRVQQDSFLSFFWTKRFKEVGCRLYSSCEIVPGSSYSVFRKREKFTLMTVLANLVVACFALAGNKDVCYACALTSFLFFMFQVIFFFSNIMSANALGNFCFVVAQFVSLYINSVLYNLKSWINQHRYGQELGKTNRRKDLEKLLVNEVAVLRQSSVHHFSVDVSVNLASNTIMILAFLGVCLTGIHWLVLEGWALQNWNLFYILMGVILGVPGDKVMVLVLVFVSLLSFKKLGASKTIVEMKQGIINIVALGWESEFAAFVSMVAADAEKNESYVFLTALNHDLMKDKVIERKQKPSKVYRWLTRRKGNANPRCSVEKRLPALFVKRVQLFFEQKSLHILRECIKSRSIGDAANFYIEHQSTFWSSDEIVQSKHQLKPMVLQASAAILVD